MPRVTRPVVEPGPAGAAACAGGLGLATAAGRLGPLFQETAGRLAAGTLCLVAGLVTARRLAGGLTTPIHGTALLAVAVAGLGLVAIADWAADPKRRLSGWLSRASLLVTLSVLGISTPVTPLSSLLAVAVLALVALLIALPPAGLLVPQRARASQHGRTMGRRRRGRRRQRQPQWPAGLGLPSPAWLRRRLPGWSHLRPAPPPPPIQPSEPTSNSAPASVRQAVSPALASRLVQWQERYLLADGKDHLRGHLLVQLAAGSRLATGHVGFCPAFPAMPAVEVSTDYDDLEVIVEAAEVLPWGIRVECRVEEPVDEPVAVPIEIRVSVPAMPSPAPHPHPPLGD